MTIKPSKDMTPAQAFAYVWLLNNATRAIALRFLKHPKRMSRRKMIKNRKLRDSLERRFRNIPEFVWDKFELFANDENWPFGRKRYTDCKNIQLQCYP